jgi:hypothetical protein
MVSNFVVMIRAQMSMVVCMIHVFAEQTAQRSVISLKETDSAGCDPLHRAGSLAVLGQKRGQRPLFTICERAALFESKTISFYSSFMKQKENAQCQKS